MFCQFQLFIKMYQIDNNDHELQDTCCQGSDRSTPDAHLRKAKTAEDQSIVDSSVYNQRNHRNIKRNGYGLDRAERADQNIGQNKKRESPFDQIQINQTLGYDCVGTGKNLQKLDRK